MNICANIKVFDKHEFYWIVREHDGFPFNILPDLKRVIELKKDSCSEPEVTSIVTSLLIVLNDGADRLPTYSLASRPRLDYSYQFIVKWDGKEWIAAEGMENQRQ